MFKYQCLKCIEGAPFLLLQKKCLVVMPSPFGLGKSVRPYKRKTCAYSIGYSLFK